jgi:nucleoid DNA-binding protein
MGILVDNFLGRTALTLSDQYSIPIITVETVIKSYLKSLIVSAENGERIILDGLTSITVVKGSIDDYSLVKRTLVNRIKSIAYKHGIQITAVDQIVRGYLKSLLDLAIQGKTVVVNGITSLNVVKDAESNDYLVRGRVASSLKSRLEGKNGGKYFLRGRVSPSLRTKLLGAYS